MPGGHCILYGKLTFTLGNFEVTLPTPEKRRWVWPTGAAVIIPVQNSTFIYYMAVHYMAVVSHTRAPNPEHIKMPVSTVCNV